MRLTIDNLDGLGARDYSETMVGGSARVVRGLNTPSTFAAVLCLEGTQLPVPVRRGRVTVSSVRSSAVLFSGYLTVEPVAQYAGVGSKGAVFRLAVQAVSDEWLLDKQAAVTRIGPGYATAGGTLLKELLARLGAGAAGFDASALGTGTPVGVYEPSATASFSANAARLASAANSAYRALNGAVSLGPVGGVTHAFSDEDGTLSVGALKTSSVRELANDVTLSGAMEPVVYWNELFEGDGTTAIFELTGQTDAVNAGHAVLIDDLFDQGAIDTTTWNVSDAGGYLSLGAGGFTVSGGDGLDGHTTLTAYDAVELGGTLVIELGSVRLNPGSEGVLGGVYSGMTQLSNCFAGFHIRPGTGTAAGQTVVVPLVNGVETGTGYTVATGHTYTLRIRLRSPELLRVKQAYYATVETGSGFAMNEFGGGQVAAPISVVFEASDLGLSSNTPVTVLYDGQVAASPASASLVAVNSLQLFGSIGAVRVNRTGTGWVQSTDPASGTVSTRLVGTAGTGVDCTISGTALEGKVTFFAGREPAVGEIVSVAYRGSRRAIARLADKASVAAEAEGGGNGTARWLGRVVAPPARSTEDCEAAAQAVLSFAASRSAALSGSFTAVNPGDVWPGDGLHLTAEGNSLSGIVRKTTIVDGGSAPEVLRYELAFANDWAEALGATLSEAIAADALLPGVAFDKNQAVRVLANLQSMTVVSATSAHTALTVDAGRDAPPGGGFEVRRRDSGFGQTNGDLVLRSPVRGFTIPVTATGEAFFVRMYDGSSPPLYSRASSAVLTHLPLG